MITSSTLPRSRGRVRRLLSGGTKRNQFARFVVVGVVTSALYTILYVLLEPLGDQGANAVALVASTVLANEMHRQLTFRAAGRLGFLPAQLESGGIAIIALIATTAALAIVNRAVPDASWVFEVAVVLAVTGVIGAVKFFALRGLVFS